MQFLKVIWLFLILLTYMEASTNLTTESEARIFRDILSKITSDDPILNAMILNLELKKRKLPRIRYLDKNFRSESAKMINTAGSQTIGFSFHDDHHEFCFPCTVSHNNFKWGIFTIEKKKDDPIAKRLHRILMNAFRDQEKDQGMVGNLNTELRLLSLPEINTTCKEFKFNRSYMIGFAGSDFIGAEIKDDKFEYCLPCTIGHNNFKWGIFPIKAKEEVNTNKPITSHAQ